MDKMRVSTPIPAIPASLLRAAMSSSAVQPFEHPAPDPLAGIDQSTALSDEKAPDGKSLVNPPRDGRSVWYESCPELFTTKNNIFDFHIYYNLNSKGQVEHARKLHERLRREFPELRIYKFWEQAVGPHPTAMFEVNTFTPAQTGALLSFLVVYRGGLSIHPNTDNEYRDHTDRATWMGQPYPLITEMLRAQARF
ncbi:hypothetical protein ACM66B_005192 [Microbotryomycetes sp. NB124-2]